ncbi:MAG: bifunctional diaminohydroxyphosphoribosylaminopyrimidine deaminase/5-amino-6-(5-phosphoribosylamino)uracil reductase RibD [Bacteroidota bacterium]|nr:bifunctional diaminohydroxyphosphoribosylaminopyrimidine deaminase/5-amino-6-(5-phosphoribosylamino)uracil reductase RibD [Bacteroidota bacterium]
MKQLIVNYYNLTIPEKYMSRCIELAKLAAGQVAPNPMVGAVLVYEDKIIGEGYHKKYGEPHAEVNCINSVADENKALIEKSSLYVSLEPCSHYGKTPPCVDLIIKNNIKKVVIGCKDIYKEVAGKGLAKLQNAGTGVVLGVLENECKELNKRFFTFHQKIRPYIILKWAQSANGKTGSLDRKRILISNEYSNRIVHQWRSEEAAILVGTNTALKDNPALTTRLWEGNNPVRIVIDTENKLPSNLEIFNRDAQTIIFNFHKNSIENNIRHIKLETSDFVEQLLNSLFENNIQSVLIEGGTKTLQSFIDSGLWDEARIIINQELIIENGLASPGLTNATLKKQERYFSDLISYYRKK